MFRMTAAVLVASSVAFAANAGEDPPCDLTGEDICHVLPPPDPPCPPGYKVCCYHCAGQYVCETCVPESYPCTNVQVCAVDKSGNPICPGFPPAYSCGGCETTTLPSCWVCTTLESSCPDPPRVGSIMTFGLDMLATCDLDGPYTWTICQGGNLVVALDPLNPPNSLSTLRLRATGAGSVTVRGAVDGPGCGGGTGPFSPYLVAKTVVIAAACPGDVNGDGEVNVLDLNEVIAMWGNPGCGGANCCRADLDGDGDVDTSDMLAVINGWGPCS